MNKGGANMQKMIEFNKEQTESKKINK